MYTVDMGDHRETWSLKAIRSYYQHNVDHSEYADFVEWWDDMTRNGIITKA
jgi:hypothetical protein